MCCKISWPQSDQQLFFQNLASEFLMNRRKTNGVWIRIITRRLFMRPWLPSTGFSHAHELERSFILTIPIRTSPEEWLYVAIILISCMQQVTIMWAGLSSVHMYIQPPTSFSVKLPSSAKNWHRLTSSSYLFICKTAFFSMKDVLLLFSHTIRNQKL